MHEPHARPVVVAVDGSPESEAALRWAADYAAAFAAPLRLLLPHQVPDVGSDAAGGYWTRFDEEEAAARRRLAAIAHRVLGRTSDDHMVLAGPMERALPTAAANAALVVVGDPPGRGWRLLRRSVAERVRARVPCPVVSVPRVGGSPAVAAVDLSAATPAFAGPSPTGDRAEPALSAPPVAST